MQAIPRTPHDFVVAQLYPNEEVVMREALQALWQNRPEVRINWAVYQYQQDQDLSLAKAAALAGVSFERMKAILSNRGIALRLGPATLSDAHAEVETMEHWFDQRLD